MTDSLTSVYRDEKRQELFKSYISTILGYFDSERETAVLREDVFDAARKLDAVGDGYVTISTNQVKWLEENFEKLVIDSKKTWGELLNTASIHHPELANKLKLLSPFKDKLILFNHPNGIMVLEESQSQIKKQAETQGLFGSQSLLILLDDQVEFVQYEDKSSS